MISNGKTEAEIREVRSQVSPRDFFAHLRHGHLTAPRVASASGPHFRIRSRYKANPFIAPRHDERAKKARMQSKAVEEIWRSLRNPSVSSDRLLLPKSSLLPQGVGIRGIGSGLKGAQVNRRQKRKNREKRKV